MTDAHQIDEGGTPTMKEVASRAGVALSSVSRVINNHPDVSEEMRARVRSAIDELGYGPNLIASSLRRGSTMTIGFIVSDISNPLFADISKGAAETLHRAGYSMVLANSEANPERDEEMIRLFRWRRVDGLIISLSDQEREETINELKRLEAPIVVIDREVRGLPDASVVAVDHAGGLRRAADHLLDLGHRRISLITGPRGIRPTQERIRGFTEAYSSRELGFDDSLIKLGSADDEFGGDACAEMLRDRDPPSAIVAGSNRILVGVLRTLRREGKVVGKDIALISCDDIPLTELHEPPITVVSRNTVRMGQLAAELLLDRIQDESTTPRVSTVPTELIVRGSTFPAE